MAKHNELGHIGEQKAIDFLVRKGYGILAQDWKYEHNDIDIVAEKEGEIVFVEVKTRTSDDFGTPEEAVTPSKVRHIIRAAEMYIRLNDIDQPIRFDIISLIGYYPDFRIEHIEDAFQAPRW